MNAILRSWATSTAMCFVLAAAGCAEEKKPSSSTTDAGVQDPQKPVLDGKLAAAVKAAESAQASAPAAGGGDGPPESGVFAPGAGDKAHAPGAPPRVELLGEGSEPRVALAPAPMDGEQKESVSLNVRLQSGLIPVDYALVAKVDKPKDDKKDKDKKADASPHAFKVITKVASVSAPPQVPRELVDKLGKLKGTEIRYTVGPDGALSDVGYALGKDGDPGLGEAVVKALVDMIAVAMPALPAKPVGAGAYWMVTDRASTFGVEVVRYRVFRIEKIDKDHATLSIDVRQYAAKGDADLGVLANNQKLSIQHFESNGKGNVDWAAASLLPAHGEASQRTGVAGLAGGQQAILQAELSAKFGGSDADKPDKKK